VGCCTQKCEQEPYRLVKLICERGNLTEQVRLAIENIAEKQFGQPIRLYGSDSVLCRRRRVECSKPRDNIGSPLGTSEPADRIRAA
jgi:hypothetical protein